MNIQCEDCKFADWDYRLFIGYVNYMNYSSHTEYHTEQFDVHCKRLNCFFLEDDVPGSCRFGESIKNNEDNNYHEICTMYYKQKQEYYNLLNFFRKTLENKEEIVDEWSEKEYKLWVEYLKERNSELYNKMID